MVQATIDLADVFGDRLTTAEREQLYQESKAWFRRYGVSDRPMPADYAASRSTSTTSAVTSWKPRSRHAG